MARLLWAPGYGNREGPASGSQRRPTQETYSITCSCTATDTELLEFQFSSQHARTHILVSSEIRTASILQDLHAHVAMQNKQTNKRSLLLLLLPIALLSVQIYSTLLAAKLELEHLSMADNLDNCVSPPLLLQLGQLGGELNVAAIQPLDTGPTTKHTYCSTSKHHAPPEGRTPMVPVSQG